MSNFFKAFFLLMGSLVAKPLFCTVRLVTADVTKNCLQQNYNNEKNKIYLRDRFYSYKPQ